MKAIGYVGAVPLDEPTSFLEFDTPTPEPSGRDVLVKVNAIAVNPVDFKIRQSLTNPQKPPRILGWDAAGEVASVGPGVSLFQAGDKVYYAGDVSRSGSNSEYQLVDEHIVGHMPTTLSFSQAAALPLTAITAWEGLFHRLQVPSPPKALPQKSLLIIGGAGGVGSIAIQLAANIAGLEVIATASRAETVAWCKKQGAHHVINHHEDIAAQLKAIDRESVDYIFILQNTDQHFPTAAQVIAPQGRICSIVENESPLPVNLLKKKSASFHWELMFTRSLFQTDDMIEQHYLLNEISRLIDSRILTTTVQDVMQPINAENIRKAHAALEGGRTIGKIVLEGWE